MTEPRILLVPEGHKVSEVLAAIHLCRQLGILVESETGWWIMPRELEPQCAKVAPRLHSLVQRYKPNDQ
jgi:hypothetical protein